MCGNLPNNGYIMKKRGISSEKQGRQKRDMELGERNVTKDDGRVGGDNYKIIKH